MRCGIEERQIAIMSLYRQQNKLLSYLLQEKKHIEILTADKSQGRDKDCVIISMVRSNDHGQVRSSASCAAVSSMNFLLLGWRFIKGLATGQRIIYARTVQARDYWFAEDAWRDGVVGRVFRVDGEAAVVAHVRGRCGEDASDVGTAQDGDREAGWEARGWGGWR